MIPVFIIVVFIIFSYLCWKYKEKILELIKGEKTKENLVNEVEDVEMLTKKEKRFKKLDFFIIFFESF